MEARKFVRPAAPDDLVAIAQAEVEDLEADDG